MRKLDIEKFSKLSTANDILDDKYGKEGTASRAEFDAKALAWYYGSLIRDRRQELKLTQREVAEKIGREQTYIARVKKGKNRFTTLQLLSHRHNPGYSISPDICICNEITMCTY